MAASRVATSDRPTDAPALTSAATLASARANEPIRVERLTSLSAIDTVLATLAAGSAAATGFQSLAWLSAVYRHLVPASGNEPLALALHDQSTGELLGLLPLYVYRHGQLRVAKFADCGVTDYNATLTRDAPAAARLAAADLLPAIKRACTGIDILALERMLSTSPLATHPKAKPSDMSGNVLTIDTTVDDYIRRRGKKYRKEAERSFRVLESHGPWTCERETTPDGIAAAFAALEQQQAERHSGKGDQYALAAPQYGAFYRDLLTNSPDTAHIFTLKVNGTIIAALMGITHGNTFTLLRTANGGEAWRQVSPGRLIVIEAMRHFCQRGVTVFDMGIGDYAFKRSFGTTPIPLTDLVTPLSWRAIPTVTARHLKQRLRENEHLRSTVRALKSRLAALRS